MSRKPFKAFAAMALAALALTACSGPNSNDSKNDPAAQATPKAGGQATILLVQEPKTLDPAVMRNNATNGGPIGNALYGALLVTTGDKVTSGLAQSATTNDKGKTWVVTLREGLKFSDGSNLDAAAVAFNWERLKDPALASFSRSLASGVASTQAAGGVLTATLTKALPNFPEAVSMSSMNWIASPAALQAGPAAFDKAPIGAGPFALETWARSDRMVFAKNTSYYDNARPYLDKLTMRVNGDDNQRIQTVISKGADGAMTTSASTIELGEQGGLKFHETVMSGGVELTFNTRSAPFDDPRAREAVSKAVDLDAVNAAAYEGKALVPYNLFATDSPFYDERISLKKFDKSSAQRLFDEIAASGRAVAFTITAYQTAESRTVSEAVQAQLSAYKNVEAKVEVLDSAAAGAKIAKNSFQVIPTSLSFRDPDPQLYESLHSSSSANTSGISDPELDAALEEGRAATDPAARKQAYDKVQQRYAALNMGLLYYRQRPGMLASPRLQGVAVYGNGSVLLDGAWLSE